MVRHEFAEIRLEKNATDVGAVRKLAYLCCDIAEFLLSMNEKDKEKHRESQEVLSSIGNAGCWRLKAPKHYFV